MSFVPSCRFDLQLRDEVLYAGVRNYAVVHVFAPEPIPRAQRLEVRFASIATATFEGREETRSRSRGLAGLTFQMRLDGLAQGAHQIPLVLDLPAWVPPTILFPTAQIEHRIHFDLDVDWALDVEAFKAVRVVAAPWQGPVDATPVTLRTGPELGQELALDLALASTTVAEGDVLRGTVALRTGHRAPFDFVNLSIVHLGEVLFAPPLMAARVERTPVGTVAIPMDALRTGDAVEFRIPIERPVPTQQNGVLDLRAQLELSIPGLPRRSSIPLRVAPRGTVVSGGNQPFVSTGLGRMGAIAEAVAASSGLQRDRWPTLARGREGMVDVVVADESRGSDILAVEHHRFPSLRLGLTSRARREIFATPSLSPPLMAESWIVQAAGAGAGAGATLGESVLRDFVAKALAGYSPAHLELSDDHLTMWHRVEGDAASDWATLAVAARERARAMDAAIRAFPFFDESLREGWTRAAADESALLLPHLPSLAFVHRVARTLGGDERRVVCAITGRSEANETRVTVAFDAPVPNEALLRIARSERDHPLAASLKSSYVGFRVDSAYQLTATAAGIPADPRALLDTLSAFLDWQMRARGEHPVVAPYR